MGLLAPILYSTGKVEFDIKRFSFSVSHVALSLTIILTQALTLPSQYLTLTFYTQAHALLRANFNARQNSHHRGSRLVSSVTGQCDDFIKRDSSESPNFKHALSDSTGKPKHDKTNGIDESYWVREDIKHDTQTIESVLNHDRQATKSDILKLALGDIGREYGREENARKKLDLSFVSPIVVARGMNESEKRRYVQAKQSVGQYRDHRFSRSLPVLLALYIEGMYSNLENSVKWEESLEFGTLSHSFSEANLNKLRSKGYDAEDLLTWTWILTAKTADQAAKRLTAYSNHVQQNIDGGKAIPTFLFTFLLRRRNFSSRGLRLMVAHGWDRLLFQRKFHAKDYQPAENLAEKAQYPRMTEISLILIVIRLLRHARVTWPVGMISITSMITKHLNGDDTQLSPPPKGLINNDIARITFTYNTILSLLAGTVSLSPFQSVIHQQQAQFQVIRKMNEFQPSLIIDREGYRAIVRVQLAHMKTPSERLWAEMKAKSWPPWKEEKFGLDTSIGRDHGQSRAREILTRSREAGYAPQRWEKVAGVFAGWDTDLSPTIQTKTQLSKPQKSRYLTRLDNDAIGTECDGSIWAARILCTRTIDEAWACFLSYRRMSTQASENVYFSFFEKIVFHEKKSESREPAHDPNVQELNSEAIEKSLPGDGKETWPNPGPSEAIYVRTPAPSREDFYRMMIDDKIRPSGKFLSYLLRYAKSYTEGVQYLNISQLPQNIIEAFLNEDTSKDVYIYSQISYVDIRLFSAFITFLVESAVNSTEPLKRTFYMNSAPPVWSNPLKQAFRLLNLMKPFYLPPWYSFLQAIIHPRTIVDPNLHGPSQNFQNIIKWEVVCSVLDKMKEVKFSVDFEGFRLLCVGFEKALISFQILSSPTNHADEPADGHDSVDSGKENSMHINSTQFRLQVFRVSSRGLARLKRIFKKLAELKFSEKSLNRKICGKSFGMTQESLVDEADFDPATLLPRIHDTLHPSHLHAFIRVLGISGDHDGILHVLRWMNNHVAELRSSVDNTFNGRRMTRTSIVAVAAFLLRGWSPFGDGMGKAASPEIVEEACGIIRDHADWGGWPTDEEVDVYFSKFSRKRWW